MNIHNLNIKYLLSHGYCNGLLSFIQCFHPAVYSPFQLLPCLSFQVSLIRCGPKAFNQLGVCASWNMSWEIAWSSTVSPKSLCSYTSTLRVYEHILERKFTLEDKLYAIYFSITAVYLSVLIYTFHLHLPILCTLIRLICT